MHKGRFVLSCKLGYQTTKGLNISSNDVKN